MPLPQPTAPHPDDPTGSSDATPSWAADMAEADSAQSPLAASAATQLPLFAPRELAAPAPHARLRAGFKSLLTVRRPAPATAAASANSTLPGASWPDSFFDADAAREP